MNHDIKELLTLAAKACGKDLTDWLWIGNQAGFYLAAPFNPPEYWAPHIDDGDCFRMETELEFNVSWFTESVLAATWSTEDNDVISRCEHFKDHNGDKNAARRLASLRVAAELGRRMKL
jgi:hypothetical protein